jgi:hypothetical protein
MPGMSFATRRNVRGEPDWQGRSNHRDLLRQAFAVVRRRTQKELIMNAAQIAVRMTVVTSATWIFALSPSAFGAMRYAVVDLTAIVAPDDLVTPADINKANQIVGQVAISNVTRAFVVSDGQLTLLAPLPNSDYSTASAINSSGQIVGSSDDQGIPKAVYWSAAAAKPTMLESGGSPNAYVYAKAINDGATITGFFTDSASDSPKSWTAVKWQPYADDPTRFRLSKLATPVPPAGTPAGAYGINSADQIVGSGAVDLIQPMQGPLRWSPAGSVSPLDMLPSVYSHHYDVVAINDAAIAVGRMVTITDAERALRWNADNTIDDLGLPAGFDQSAAVDINSVGTIVGRATNGAASIATIFRDGAWSDLNNLTVNADGWSLEAAVAINDHGKIVGIGQFQGSPRAFLLEPKTPVQLGDYNRDGTVDAGDYSVWRNSLGQTGPGLAADGNLNNQVDAGDYNVWKSNFGEMSGSGSLAGALRSNGPVPEPATSALTALAAAFAVAAMRRARSAS